MLLCEALEHASFASQHSSDVHVPVAHWMLALFNFKCFFASHKIDEEAGQFGLASQHVDSIIWTVVPVIVAASSFKWNNPAEQIALLFP